MCRPSSACPQDHRLRAIRKLVDEVLRDMSGEFDGCMPALAVRRFRQSGPSTTMDASVQ
jgi:hypothetical protein